VLDRKDTRGLDSRLQGASESQPQRFDLFAIQHPEFSTKTKRRVGVLASM
jgi:hypothetical protein